MANIGDFDPVLYLSKKQKTPIEQTDFDKYVPATETRERFSKDMEVMANTSIQLGSDTVKIFDRIGFGMFSTVFRCNVNNKELALRAVDLSCEPSLKIVIRDFENSSAINSPNVLGHGATFNYGTPRKFFTFMSLAVCNLNQMIVKNEITGGLKVCRQILMGLKAIHAKNIIHRNMKPHNVLYFSSGVFKISDFWMSIHSEYAYRRVGTTFYRAPEITGGIDYTNKVDVYATGLIMVGVLNNTDIHNWDIRKCVFFIEQPKLRRLILDMLSFSEERRPTIRTALRILREVYGLMPQSTETELFRNIDFQSHEGLTHFMNKMNLEFCCTRHRHLKIWKVLTTQTCYNPHCTGSVFETILDNMEDSSIGPLFKTMNKFLKYETVANEQNRKHAYDTLEKVAKKFLVKNGKIGGPGVVVSFKHYKSVEYGSISVYWEKMRPLNVRFFQHPALRQCIPVRREFIADGSILNVDNSSDLWTELIKKIYKEPVNLSESVCTRSRYYRKRTNVPPCQMATRAMFLTLRIKFGEEALRKLMPFFRS